MNLVRSRSWGLVKPSPGTPINLTHPLATGLAFVCLFRGMGLADEVLNTPVSKVGTTPITIDGLTGSGLASLDSTLRLGALVQPATTPSQWPAAADNMTVLWRGWLTGGTATNNPIFAGIRNSTVPSTILGIRRGINTGTPTELQLAFRSGVTGITVNTSGLGLGTSGKLYNVPFTLIATRRIGQSTVMYLNGVEIIRDTTNLTAGTGAAVDQIAVGYNSGGANAVINGYTSHVYAWRRAVTSDEAAWLSTDPYAFFSPPGPKILYIDLGVVAASPQSVAITASTASWSGRAFAPAGAAKTSNITAGSATWSGRALSPTPAAKTAQITPASAAWSGRAFAPTGATKANIVAAVAAWSGRALSPLGSAISRSLVAAAAAWSGRALVPNSGIKTASITPASSSWSARQLVPSPVAVNRAITAAIAVWSARSLAPGGTGRSASVVPAQAAWSARPLLTSSGARSISITAALAAWSGRALSPSAFPRASLSPASATWSARALSAGGSARSTALTAASASWHGQPFAVTGLARTISITPVTAAWSASALSVLNILSVHLPPGQTTTVVRFTQLTRTETRPNAGTSTLVQQQPTSTR